MGNGENDSLHCALPIAIRLQALLVTFGQPGHHQTEVWCFAGRIKYSKFQIYFPFLTG